MIFEDLIFDLLFIFILVVVIEVLPYEHFGISEKREYFFKYVGLVVLLQLLKHLVILDNFADDVQLEMSHFLHENEEKVPLLNVDLLFVIYLPLNFILLLIEEYQQDVFRNRSKFLYEYLVFYKELFYQHEYLEDGEGPSDVNEVNLEEVLEQANRQLGIEFGMADHIFEELNVEGVQNVGAVFAFLNLFYQGVQKQRDRDLNELRKHSLEIAEHELSDAHVLVHLHYQEHQGLIYVRRVLTPILREVRQQVEHALQRMRLQHYIFGSRTFFNLVKYRALLGLRQFLKILGPYAGQKGQRVEPKVLFVYVRLEL